MNDMNEINFDDVQNENRVLLNLKISQMLALLEDRENAELFYEKDWYNDLTTNITGGIIMPEDITDEMFLLMQEDIYDYLSDLYCSDDIDDYIFRSFAYSFSRIYMLNKHLRELFVCFEEFVDSLLDNVYCIDDVDGGIEGLKNLIIPSDIRYCIIIRIITQFTLETICNYDDMEKIIDFLIEKDVFSEEKSSYSQIMNEIISGLNDYHAGIVLTFLSNLRDNELFAVIEKTLMRYFALTPTQRQNTDIDELIVNVLEECGYQSVEPMSTIEFFDILVDAYRGYLKYTDMYLDEADAEDN